MSNTTLKTVERHNMDSIGRSFERLKLEFWLYDGMTEEEWVRQNRTDVGEPLTDIFSEELVEKIVSTLRERKLLQEATLGTSDNSLADPNNSREEARVNVDDLPTNLQNKISVGSHYHFNPDSPRLLDPQPPVIFSERFPKQATGTSHPKGDRSPSL